MHLHPLTSKLTLRKPLGFTSRKIQFNHEGEDYVIRLETNADVRYAPREQMFYLTNCIRQRGYWGYNGDSLATAGRQGWKMEELSRADARQIPLSDLDELLEDVPLNALERALKL